MGTQQESNLPHAAHRARTQAGSVAGAVDEYELHFGCVHARSPRRVRWFAARGAGRAAAHIAVAALTGGCDDGVQGHSRSGANPPAARSVAEGLPGSLQGVAAPPVRSPPCARLLKIGWPPRRVQAACAVRSPHKKWVEKTERPGNLAVVRAVVGHLVQAPGMKGVRLGTALPRMDVGFLRTELRHQRAGMAGLLARMFGQRPKLAALATPETGVHQRATAEAAVGGRGVAGVHDEALRKKKIEWLF
jgi:hypothetical protein